MRIKTLTNALAIVGLCTVSSAALATNGYFSNGYGDRAKGMGGAATAVAGDAFGGANNPATMAWAGDRLDVGVELFSPPREISRTGSGAAGLDGSAKSGSNYFVIPDFGYNKMLSKDLSLGITVYGNGGMNTDYPAGQVTSAGGTTTCNNFQTGGMGTAASSYNLLCGNGRLGVDLAQLIIAPTVAYKVSENTSIGVSPLIGYQRFKMSGLQGFGGFSSDANNLTNRGYDDSFGYGVRVGFYAKLTEGATFGASYATKMNMERFKKYQGLFAEQGSFDLPENYNIGISFTPIKDLLVALDYQHISYGGVQSVHNSSQLAGSVQLGKDGGPGFGWENVDVVKLGAEWRLNNAVTLRAGVAHNNNPIKNTDVTFNILAPAVGTTHYTLGGSYDLTKDSSLTTFFVYQPERSVNGKSLYANFGLPSSTTETIKIRQYSLGIAYGVKF